MQALRYRLANTNQSPWPEQPVRLALVITDLDLGGAERAMVNLVTRLDRSRWTSKVFALAGEGRFVDVLRREGIECVCLKCTRHRPFEVINRLSHALRKFQPQIIQSFLFHANLASRLAAPWARRPWVVGGLRVAEREKRWHLLLDRLTSWLSTGSVCVSEGVLVFSRDIARISPQRLIVIPNGIDPGPFDQAKEFPRKELKITSEAHLALFVGRLDRQKGIPALLEASKLVIAQCPDWHLVLVGDGPCRTWMLEEVAAQPSLAERVHWLGVRDDIPALLKACDVLVLPSLWEGMPNVILEAMAASKAVVATSVEGTEELVVADETGWLVPPGDAQELSTALLSAAVNPDRCRHFGLRGRERIERRFSINQIVRAYDRLWAQLLGYHSPLDQDSMDAGIDGWL